MWTLHADETPYFTVIKATLEAAVDVHQRAGQSAAAEHFNSSADRCLTSKPCRLEAQRHTVTPHERQAIMVAAAAAAVAVRPLFCACST